MCLVLILLLFFWFVRDAFEICSRFVRDAFGICSGWMRLFHRLDHFLDKGYLILGELVHGVEFMNVYQQSMCRFRLLPMRDSRAAASRVAMCFLTMRSDMQTGWKPNERIAQGKRSDTLGIIVLSLVRPVRAKALILKYIFLVVFYSIGF